jgi:hypothetical protein
MLSVPEVSDTGAPDTGTPALRWREEKTDDYRVLASPARDSDKTAPFGHGSVRGPHLTREVYS